jgi:hypothetical protein
MHPNSTGSSQRLVPGRRSSAALCREVADGVDPVVDVVPLAGAVALKSDLDMYVSIKYTQGGNGYEERGWRAVAEDEASDVCEKENRV